MMSTLQVSIFRAAGIAAIAVLGVGLGCSGDNGTNPTDSYTLNIEVNPLGSGIVSRDPNNTVYKVGTVVAVKATAKSDYEFVSWSGALNDAVSSVTVTMNGNVALTANFRQRTVTPPASNTFTDSRDGKIYRKVSIGSQVWMGENLNYNASGSLCYDCPKYGRLYNWNTAMNSASSSSANPSGVRGVCPVGWHLPSDVEWTTLVNYVGDSSSAGMKLKSTTGWQDDGNGTDQYGFSALPGGVGIVEIDSYGGNGIVGVWWSTTEYSADNARTRSMASIGAVVARGSTAKANLSSVRCVQD